MFDRFLQKSNASQLGLLFLLIVVLVFVSLGFGSLFNADFTSITNNQLNKIEAIVSSSNSPTDVSLSFSEKLVYVLGRIIDPGYIGDSESAVFSSIISFIGWVFCSGFLIAIITNGYFERIKKIEKGIVRYRLKGHCIIIGSDHLHLSIIRNIRSGKHNEHSGVASNCKIVIFSSKDAVEIRNDLNAFLNNEEKKNIYVYRGNRVAEEHIVSLGVNNAAEIYVLGENNEIGRDSMNIACVGIIDKILNPSQSPKNGKAMPIPCAVLLDDLRTYDLLTEVELTHKRSLLKLSHFNNYDSWSSRLFSNDYRGFQLIKEQVRKSWNDEYKVPFRFVIVGFNRMGESLLNQAIRTLHLGPDQKVVISVIDIEARKYEEKYRSRCPGFALLKKEVGINVEFLAWDIESKIARDNIERWVVSGSCNLLGIAVCFHNSTYSLYNGLKLPELVETKNIPVFIYQEELHGLAKSIEDKNKKFQVNQQKDFSHGTVSFFGMVANSVYFFSDREKTAKAIQQRYQMFCCILDQPDKPYDKDWDELDEKAKWANRYKAESSHTMHVLLALLYKKLAPEKATNLLPDRMSSRMAKLLEALLFFRIFGQARYVTTGPVDNKFAIAVDRLKQLNEKVNQYMREGELTVDEHVLNKVDENKLFEALEYISETEHRRWMAEKITSGWNYNFTRDDARKLHPDLKPYKQLNEWDKMYDRGGFL